MENNFTYNFEKEAKYVSFLVKIPDVSSKALISDYAIRNDVPLWEEKSFGNALCNFIENESLLYYDNLNKKTVSNFLNDYDFLIHDIADYWAKFYNKDEPTSINYLTDEQIFADAYSYLIVSPYLETMLQLEYEHLVALKKQLDEREKDMIELIKRNEEEMENALINPVKIDPQYISSLANKHSEDKYLLQSSWDSKISCVKTLQKNELREWIMKVYEDDVLKKGANKDIKCQDKNISSSFDIQYSRSDNLLGQDTSTNFKSLVPTDKPYGQFLPRETRNRSMSSYPANFLASFVKSMNIFNPDDRMSPIFYNETISDKTTPIKTRQMSNPEFPGTSFYSPSRELIRKTDVLQEESFTVNLGCQLKSTYNLRLLRCNLLPHFCDFDEPIVHDASESPDPTNPHEQSNSKFNDFIRMNPNKLQTLLTLYTDRLQAIVVIEDGRLEINCPGALQDLAKICDRSTEYHFPQLDRQIDNIKRSNNSLESPTRSTNILANISKSTSNNVSLGNMREQFNLETGDVYITRHSNLSRVHLVFHLCVHGAEEWKWIRSGHDTSIRNHAEIFEGLRNIIKMCFGVFEVQSLTIPLLLADEIGEEMTLNWCMKRAELVFKCVKGYVIETQSSTSSLNNLESSLNGLIKQANQSDNTFQGTTSKRPLQSSNLASIQSNDSVASSNYNRCKVIQFQLPTALNELGFDYIANMLPTVFRLPTPIVG